MSLTHAYVRLEFKDTMPEEHNDLNQMQAFGQATENIFSRIYRSLQRRAQHETENTTEAMPIGLATTSNTDANPDKVYFRKQLIAKEQEIKQLYGIIATMNQGVIIQNPEGRITMMNRAASEMLGSVKNFWQSELGTLFNNYRELEQIHGELEPLGRTEEFTVNNMRLAVNVGAIADSDGERFGTIMLLTDVTRDTLADRIKDSVITSISHEFKTPMNVMRIASEILLGQPEDAPANRKMLEKLSRNIDILDRMVLELLDIAEMNSGNFSIQPEPLELEPILNDIILGFQPESIKAKLNIELWARQVNTLRVEGDVARLKWALGHLLRNAIAYTPKGHVRLIAYPDFETYRQPHAVIQLHDTGVGISESDLPKIFDLMYRGQPYTQEGKLIDSRGLGQGLFIARKVAEAHDGYLYADTRLYEGSVFTMILPLNTSA
jgi:signal transduction histidine kinase